MPFLIAVIAGTGMARLFSDGSTEKFTVDSTPYGGPVTYMVVQEGGQRFVFLDRHNNSGRFRLPHHLNRQAYMWVLAEELGVTHILATSAVGGIRNRFSGLSVGDLVLPDDFIDYTGSSWTFATESWTDALAFHRPCNDMFCMKLRRMLVVDATVMFPSSILAVAVRGPRFETPAEVVKYKRERIDLLGMPTAAPEAVLAREAGMHYQPVCCVTDIPEDRADVDGADVKQIMDARMADLRDAFLRTISSLSTMDTTNWDCQCTKTPSVFTLLPKQAHIA